jgi:hypothetical protein
MRGYEATRIAALWGFLHHGKRVAVRIVEERHPQIVVVHPRDQMRRGLTRPHDASAPPRSALIAAVANFHLTTYHAVEVAPDKDPTGADRLGADALGNEGILIDGRDLERPLVEALDEELGAGGEDAQRNGGPKRIVAVVLPKLGFGRHPFARDRRGRADALGLQRGATLEQSEGVCAVSFALRPQQRVELQRIESPTLS